MNAYIENRTENGWYLCMHADEIVGGLGVIDNDFHNRKDLRPNVCAVYTEEAHRRKGIAGELLNLVVSDMKEKGISPLYLITDHIDFPKRKLPQIYQLLEQYEEGKEIHIFRSRQDAEEYLDYWMSDAI